MYSWASTPNSGEFSNKHWHFTQQSMGNMWAVMNLGGMLVELSLFAQIELDSLRPQLK
jgi:hypothetical protein